MQSLLHPNQVRSACERCRKQKLKCIRAAPYDPTCSRCEKLGLTCKLGTQRRVGRPIKKETAVARVPSVPSNSNHMHTSSPMGSPPMVSPYNSPPTSDSGHGLDHNSPFIQPDLPVHGQAQAQTQTQTDPVIDWMFADEAGYVMGSGEQELPPVSSPYSMATAQMPVVAPPTPVDASSVVQISSDAHFTALSKLNKELHAFCENMSHRDLSHLESYVYDTNRPADPSSTLRPYQYMIKMLQDYLMVIRALHKSLDTGSRILPDAEANAARQAGYIMVIHPSLASPISDGGSSSRTSPGHQQPESNKSRILLDSPTALLVISCFSQMLYHLEIFVYLAQTRLADPANRMIPGDYNAFGGIPVIDFLTQGALLIELMRSLFGQIIVLIGMPTDPWWSGKSLWKGLLTDQRLRAMLNKELGSIENGWSTRPGKVIEGLELCRTMIFDCSLLG